MRTDADPCIERVNAILETTEAERSRLVAEIAVLKASNCGMKDEILRLNTCVNALRTELALRSDDH